MSCYVVSCFVMSYYDILKIKSHSPTIIFWFFWFSGFLVFCFSGFLVFWFLRVFFWFPGFLVFWFLRVGHYLVKLNPGYTDLDIVLSKGLVAGRAAHVWVAVVNKSAEGLLFDRQLPFAILEAFDDEVLDLLDGTEPNINRSVAPDAAQCAAFTDSDDERYTDEEARSLADASPEDFARWRQVAQTFTFGEHLDDRQVCRLGRFLEVHRQQFAYPGDKIEFIRGHEHRIDTGDNPPVARPPYRISGGEKKITEDEVRRMLKAGVIVPIQSAWASPVVLVNKRDGSVRFCVDYRALNSITKPDLFPLPRIDDCLDVLCGNDTFTTMDACSAYWQVPRAEDSIHKTAMVTHMGHYAWKFMPFGLRNEPATMSRVVEQLYEGYNRSICMVYLDDTITFSQGFDEHLDRLGLLFARMKTFGLKLKPEKCAFARSSVSFLGHLITADGIAPDPDRVRSIAELTPPTTVTGVRAFLGFTGFYRRFIRGYADIARPVQARAGLRPDRASGEGGRDAVQDNGYHPSGRRSERGEPGVRGNDRRRVVSGLQRGRHHHHGHVSRHRRRLVSRESLAAPHPSRQLAHHSDRCGSAQQALGPRAAADRQPANDGARVERRSAQIGGARKNVVNPFLESVPNRLYVNPLNPVQPLERLKTFECENSPDWSAKQSAQYLI